MEEGLVGEIGWVEERAKESQEKIRVHRGSIDRWFREGRGKIDGRKRGGGGLRCPTGK